MIKNTHRLLYLLFISLSLISQTLYSKTTLVQLNPDNHWQGENRQKLNSLINQFGINSPKYDPHHKPVAAFDWDNTMMKNDIGEATLLWMVSHGLLKRPERWNKMNPWLSNAAILELEKNCSDSSSQFLPTQRNSACADTLLNIYHNKPLENGKPAWNTSSDPERIFPPYFFYAQLFAGYTPQELSVITQKALNFNLANKIGATQRVGSKDYPAYVRIYSPMNNLVSVLKKNGFDVWIISASIQPSVEVVAKQVGIHPDHVVGIRQMLNDQGELTDTFQGCGPYPDGNKEVISNRLGKRCWLNKVVFKLKDNEQINTPAPIVFAAGDSSGDLTFLKDAQGGRLVINKNNPELLCAVSKNSDGKWLINPMFIEPLPLEKTPLDCS